MNAQRNDSNERFDYIYEYFITSNKKSVENDNFISFTKADSFVWQQIQLPNEIKRKTLMLGHPELINSSRV